MKGKALLVTADSDIENTVTQRLRERQIMPVSQQSCCPEDAQQFDTSPPDIIILHLDSSGDWKKEMEARRNSPELSAVPLMAFTVNKDDALALEAFAHGAEDVYSLETGERVLAIKCEKLIHRGLGTGSGRITYRNITLDEFSRQIFVGKSEIKVTNKQFDLLRLFLKNPDRVLTREKILENVWDDVPNGSTRTVDSHVSGLKRKLGVHGDYIRSVYRKGYIFR
ncbi:winged helix-turn-helix transcriptional regulator [Limisalsivibrio acetivorans]|uniref:winged helix-turn-helix transcriptional regulator n=1 Tax=Limisalsivibrio acetivorans TaxID=1304888 RepID=UPI0003B773E1|nr:winged-helix domain-containing protein [Limisalsivibrio acetivorans]